MQQIPVEPWPEQVFPGEQASVKFDGHPLLRGYVAPRDVDEPMHSLF